MDIERKTAFAPRTERLGQLMASINQPCVGCEGCTGLCRAVIEAALLPDIVLARRQNT